MNGLLNQLIPPWLRRTGTIVPTLLLAFFVSLPAQAEPNDPDGVQFTLSACRLEDGNLQIKQFNGEDRFYCTNKAQKSAYTTGNLGKLWSELDIVPHRLEVKTQSGDPNQTYRIVLAGDHLLDGGVVPADQVIGWDLMTTPLVISGGCTIVGMDPLMNQVVDGVVGGVDSTLVRWIDIDHPSNTACVIDYGVRLSIRSSGFSGSSLHSQILKQDYSSIGNRTLSLPVKDILPQEISKTMTATRDVANTWSLQKKASDEPLDFGETCEPDKPITAQVDITVEWAVESAPGGTNVITTINAKNPSTRDIIVALSDALYDNGSASGNSFYTFMTADAILPDGVEFVYDNGDLLGILVESGYNGAIATFSKAFDLELGDELSNRVTASYIDSQYPDVPIDGTEQATSSTLVGAGNSSNDIAVISDFEQVSGNENLSFSVDEVIGEQGQFVDSYGDPIAYNLGDKVTALYWKSAEQTTGGYVTFKKTLYLAQPSILENSELYDKATLNSEEQEISADLSVTLKSNAKVKLDIIKEIDPAVLGEDESATFNFVVKHCEADNGAVNVDSVCTSIPASVTLTGEYTGFTTVSGLEPFKTYEVMEEVTEGFTTAVNPQDVTINLPNCEGEVTFVNNPIKPKAKVKKLTLPAIEGYAEGWSFTLYKNEEVFDSGTTDSNGDLTFSKELDEGKYEVKETVKDNWQLTSVTDPRDDNGNKVCEFSVDLPDDWDNVFTCTFTNEQDGRVVIRKVVEAQSGLPLDLKGSFTFSSDLPKTVGPLNTTTVDPDDETAEIFVTPGSYKVVEDDPNLQLFSFVDVECTDTDIANSGQDLDNDRTALLNVEPGELVTCTFKNRKRQEPGEILIRKITKGDKGSFGYDFDLIGEIDEVSDFALTTSSEGEAGADEELFTNVPAGVYNITELYPGEMWDLIELTCSDPREIDDVYTTPSKSTRSAVISVDDGERVTCTFVNRKRGKIIVDKVANPSDTDVSFKFSPNYADSFFLKHGEENDSGWLVPGNYKVGELVPDGWDLTKVSCESEGGANGPTSDLVPSVQNPAFISLAAGEIVRCTFTNVQRIMIDLQKYFNGTVRSDLDFMFTVYNGPDGFGTTPRASDSTLGDGDGLLDFNYVKLEGLGTFTVCELGIPVGTTAYWFLDTNNDGIGDVDLSAYVYNPNGDDPVPEDVGNRCLDFGANTALTVDPGKTLHLVVNNERPEGDRRTPGYWKNWNTCTNGNQVNTATKNGGWEEGFWLLDDLLPISVDSYLVETCDVGVAILDSRSTTTGKKMAKFADFTLARALLAAKLNVKTGDVETCNGAIHAVIDAADALLSDLDYNPEQGKVRPNSQYHHNALYLAGILDDYNNNLCNINGN